MKRQLLHLPIIRGKHIGLVSLLVFTYLLIPQTFAVGEPGHIHVVNFVGDESDSSLSDKL